MIYPRLAPEPQAARRCQRSQQDRSERCDPDPQVHRRSDHPQPLPDHCSRLQQQQCGRSARCDRRAQANRGTAGPRAGLGLCRQEVQRAEDERTAQPGRDRCGAGGHSQGRCGRQLGRLRPIAPRAAQPGQGRLALERLEGSGPVCQGAFVNAASSTRFRQRASTHAASSQCQRPGTMGQAIRRVFRPGGSTCSV